jgi:hypothetical protein
MSKNRRDCLGVECTGYNTFNSETSSTPSYDESYCATTECLPSWRQFAEGIPIFPQSHRYCISMSLEGSNYRQPSTSLEYTNLLFRSQSHLSSPPFVLPQQASTQFHPLIPSISSRNICTLPLIDFDDLSTVVTQKLTPAYQMTQKCNICGRGIARDLLRHIRTHYKGARFKCLYPRTCCRHKSGYFHRNYDLKKHLLHRHCSPR